MSLFWYEEFIGKPWKAVPVPPNSFTCGELVRYIYKHRLGIDTPDIVADPDSLRQCIENLSIPDAYGLIPVQGDPRPFDACYIMRHVRRDHIGVAVRTVEGIRILHCMRGVGVILESLAEIMGTTGCRRVEWYRHRLITPEMVECHA